MYSVALILILGLGLHVLDVKGHGAMVSPLSRNAIGKKIKSKLILTKLKVGKSQKQFKVSSILPKNEQNLLS